MIGRLFKLGTARFDIKSIKFCLCLFALTIGFHTTLAIQPTWAGGGSSEHIGVWKLDGANDLDKLSIYAVSGNENKNKLGIGISCYRDDQGLNIGIFLPNGSLDQIQDGVRLRVLYRVDDRAFKNAEWLFSKVKRFSEVPGRKLNPYLSFDFEDEDAVGILNVLYIGESLHLEIHLDDGEVITLDYDITGSRELVPRVKALCNLHEPGEAHDT